MDTPENQVDDSTSLSISSHIVIRDVATKAVIFEKCLNSPAKIKQTDQARTDIADE